MEQSMSLCSFCSAIGSGGIVPTCYTYTGEVTSRSCRPRALAALVCASGLGALLAAALATAVLPPNGALTLIENKEHFSAWHRYVTGPAPVANSGPSTNFQPLSSSIHPWMSTTHHVQKLSQMSL